MLSIKADSVQRFREARGNGAGQRAKTASQQTTEYLLKILGAEKLW